jgi:hypothetical protein
VHYEAERDTPLQVVPVETLANGWVGGSEATDAHLGYDLLKGGHYSVRAEISMRRYPLITHYINQEPFAEIGTSDWEGSLVSSPSYFTYLTDNDGDGRFFPTEDCDDTDPNIPGPAEIPGNGKDDDCDPATADALAVVPGTISVQADRHVVGAGSHPGSTKYPIEGMPIRAYDMNSSCVQALGVSWKHYPSIWLSCSYAGKVTSDDVGGAALDLAPGDYIIIGEDPESGDDIFVGRSAGGLESGMAIQKYLQIIVKADNKKVPGKYKVKTGSLLIIIEPEYVEWDGTEELYPFIFDSIGDWTVSTSVAPPEGFVADEVTLTEQVNSELGAVQFTVTDIGSDWVDTAVVHEITHKGKKEKIKSKIGVKLSKKLAKQKGLGRFGGKEKKNK